MLPITLDGMAHELLGLAPVAVRMRTDALHAVADALFADGAAHTGIYGTVADGDEALLDLVLTCGEARVPIGTVWVGGDRPRWERWAAVAACFGTAVAVHALTAHLTPRRWRGTVRPVGGHRG